MTTVEVNPGVCGLGTTIRTSSEDGQTVAVSIESRCPAIRALGQKIPEVDAWKVCFSPYGDSAVYRAAREHLQHAACPVPAAIVKAVEAEAGLALPRNVEFTITKE